jgi:E3 ubiquitin-protein ligase UBR7
MAHTDCDGKGVCYGCSISCHAEHDLVELFQRRKFRCDCPTSSKPIAGPSLPSSSSSSSTMAKQTQPQAQTTRTRTLCTLNPSSNPATSSSSPHPPNTHNRYTRNFTGKFCRCPKGETYDPMEEEESMVVCLGCEEWFHEGCLVSPLKTLVDIVVVFSVPRSGDGGRVV